MMSYDVMIFTLTGQARTNDMTVFEVVVINVYT